MHRRYRAEWYSIALLWEELGGSGMAGGGGGQELGGGTFESSMDRERVRFYQLGKRCIAVCDVRIVERALTRHDPQTCLCSWA